MTTLPFDRNAVRDLNQFAQIADVASPAFLRLFHGAREYMLARPWVKRIEQILIGRILDERAGVFLFEIAPAKRGVDKFHWVIWGDVPSAYLVLDNARAPQSAIDVYISEVRLWIKEAKAGGNLHGVLPLEWPHTVEAAEQLEHLLVEIFGSNQRSAAES